MSNQQHMYLAPYFSWMYSDDKLLTTSVYMLILGNGTLKTLTCLPCFGEIQAIQHYHAQPLDCLIKSLHKTLWAICHDVLLSNILNLKDVFSWCSDIKPSNDVPHCEHFSLSHHTFLCFFAFSTIDSWIASLGEMLLWSKFYRMSIQ